MKRLSQLLAVAVVAFLVPLGISAPALAAPTCQMGFEGPHTDNTCTSVQTYTCKVETDNKVTITNTNEQGGTSGTVSVGGNTTGGNGSSGSVVNVNGTNFVVTITNPTVGESCRAVVTVPATETPETVQPTQPTQPGQGQQASVPIRSLPVTSGGSSLLVAAVVAAGVALSAVVAAGALLVYRHFHTS